MWDDVSQISILDMLILYMVVYINVFLSTRRSFNIGFFGGGEGCSSWFTRNYNFTNLIVYIKKGGGMVYRISSSLELAE